MRTERGGFSSELARLEEFRRSLHRRPGTGFDVGQTAELVAQKLADAGLDVATGIGKTGVVATLNGSGNGPVIGFRAELDGLPLSEYSSIPHRSEIENCFHGCGHDGHTTMLVGAAQCLAEDADFAGTIRFVFQPSEEDGEGAKAMMADGLFDRFPMDSMFALHNLPGSPLASFSTCSGPVTSIEDRFVISLKGEGGHSSDPSRLTDPLPGASALICAAQTIVSRTVAPTEHAVVSATMVETDGAWNVVPSTVTISGDVRAHHTAVADKVRQRLASIVRGIGDTYGLEADLSYERVFVPTVNTEEAVNSVADAVSQCDFPDCDTTREPFGFSEDFGHFLESVPGCFFTMGNGDSQSHSRPLHSPYYDFNDQAIPIGIDFWCALARLLTQTENTRLERSE